MRTACRWHASRPTATITSSACWTTAPTALLCRWSTRGEEAESAVSACLYPPRGTRSVGGSVHALNFKTTSTDYFAHADEEILIILQCEHIQAVEDADKICSVPGMDVVFVGPNDLAASMRGKDGKGPSGEATTQALKHVLATCKKHGVAAGIHCFSAEEVQVRIAEGWQFIAINSELKMMMDGAARMLQGIGIQQKEMAKY